MFPNGKSNVFKSNVSFFLKDESDAASIKCIREYMFGVAKKDRKDDFVSQPITLPLCEMYDGRGSPKFLPHADLFDEKKGFLVDETFTVFVDVSFHP